MKIAVITLKDSPNYGGILQAYALQYKLKKMGYDCDLIDYMNDNFRQKFSFWGWPSGMKLIYWIYKKFQYPLMIFMMKKMMSFYNHMNLTKHFLKKEDLRELNNHYDAFITGSDQVWACDLNNYDDSYFLSFVNNDKLKIAYAASFGRTWEMLRQEEKEFIKPNLYRFNSISLREYSGNKIVKELTENTIESCDVLDPTLLLNKDEWSEIAKKTKKIEKIEKRPYILCYLMQSRKNDTEALDFAKQLSRRTGYKIIKICRGLTSLLWCKTLFIPTVEEFLDLYKGASYIVTNSFHGVAFSIINSKQFTAFVEGKINEGRNTRLFNICTKLDLLNRIKQVGSNEVIDTSLIDYGKIEPKINLLQSQSETFLRNSLNN